MYLVWGKYFVMVKNEIFCEKGVKTKYFVMVKNEIFCERHKKRNILLR